MEITKLGKSGFAPLSDTRSRGADETTAAPRGQRTAAGEMRVEALQAALRMLPEVDTDRVAQLKQALAEGRIDSDPSALAAGMLAYHRGNEE